MPILSKSKLWKRHADKWMACDRCDYCETRKKVIVGSGKVPCDVLFLGEAPGESEDVIGYPFAGPAGKLLRSIIDRVIDEEFDGASPRLFFSNIVACIPRDGSGKADQPSKESMKACFDRCVELVNLVEPTIVIAVGVLAEKQLVNIFQKTTVTPQPWKITHPAAILRLDPLYQGITIDRTEVTIRDAFNSFFSQEA